MLETQTLLLIMNYVIRILVIVIGSTIVNLLRRYDITKWVKIAVFSAEQVIKGAGSGVVKKQYVVDFINNKFKIGLTEADLNNLIEAIVKEMKMLQESSEANIKVQHNITREI